MAQGGWVVRAKKLRITGLFTRASYAGDAAHIVMLPVVLRNPRLIR
jgi:hypothetical protein